MTRIDQLLPGAINPAETGRKTGTAQGAGAFGEVLKEAMQSQVPQASGILAPPSAPVYVGNITPTSPEQPQTHIVALTQAERTLDALDEYGRALGDSSKSLKDVSNLAERVEGEAKDLARVMDQLPQNDELRGILEEVLVSATVESTKFHRGDFLPA